MNVFAAILAGGSGVRMGNSDKPKQYLMLGSKPILAHTVEKFQVSGLFESVIVLCPQAWVQQTRDLLRRYCPEFFDQIVITAGGSTRNETVACAVTYIEEHFDVDEETLLLTHDAVRPFVSHRIIEENVETARRCGACDTVVPASDTIVESVDSASISAIPNRKNLYQGQTPQTFNLRKLEKLMGTLTDEEKNILTDACKIFVLRGERVELVRGDVSNMKITYPQDMRVAKALIGE